MSGEVDPLYIKARSALLDATSALITHIDAITLVGAQAIYIHTGETELEDIGMVAAYTTDADFAVSPNDIAGSPTIAELLTNQGFTSRENPGSWLSPDGVTVDIMVPELLAGRGSRGADLGAHGRRAARRANGLEGTLVDRDRHTISSLDPTDQRSIAMWVAGPAALLVAKVHKIAERVDNTDRVRDKDALDILRLLRAVPTMVFAERLSVLAQSDLARDTTLEALALLPKLFGNTDADGVAMAVRAVGNDTVGEIVAASLVALANELLNTPPWNSQP